MHAILKAIQDRVWVRAAILLAVVATIAAVMVPGPVWSALALKATRYIGIYLLILVGAAVVGWLAHSRRVFFWIAGVLIFVIGSVHLFGLHAKKHFSKGETLALAAVLPNNGWSPAGTRIKDLTLGDYGLTLKLGIEDVRAMYYASGRYFSEKMGDIEGERYYRAGGQLNNMDAEDTLASLSPQARKRLLTAFSSEEFWAQRYP